MFKEHDEDFRKLHGLLPGESSDTESDHSIEEVEEIENDGEVEKDEEIEEVEEVEEVDEKPMEREGYPNTRNKREKYPNKRKKM